MCLVPWWCAAAEPGSLACCSPDWLEDMPVGCVVRAVAESWPLTAAGPEKLERQAEAGELLGLQRLYVCTALSNQPNGGLAEPLKVCWCQHALCHHVSKGCEWYCGVLVGAEQQSRGFDGWPEHLATVNISQYLHASHVTPLFCAVHHCIPLFTYLNSGKKGCCGSGQAHRLLSAHRPGPLPAAQPSLGGGAWRGGHHVPAWRRAAHPPDGPAARGAGPAGRRRQSDLVLAPPAPGVPATHRIKSVASTLAPGLVLHHGGITCISRCSGTLQHSCDQVTCPQMCGDVTRLLRRPRWSSWARRGGCRCPGTRPPCRWGTSWRSPLARTTSRSAPARCTPATRATLAAATPSPASCGSAWALCRCGPAASRRRTCAHMRALRPGSDP